MISWRRFHRRASEPWLRPCAWSICRRVSHVDDQFSHWRRASGNRTRPEKAAAAASDAFCNEHTQHSPLAAQKSMRTAGTRSRPRSGATPKIRRTSLSVTHGHLKVPNVEPAANKGYGSLQSLTCKIAVSAIAERREGEHKLLNEIVLVEVGLTT